MMLLAGMSSLFGQVSLGIRIGPPPAPRMVRIRPASPGAGYSYVDGYWYPSHGRYVWHAGYWTRPPYEGASWASPRYEGNSYIQGSWNGAGHQPMRHDHGWDKNRNNRDYNRDSH